MQQEPIHIDPETDTPLRNPETNSQEHDDIDVDLATPSSRLNGRPGKRSPVPSSKGKSLSKWRKGKLRLSEPNTGECYLLSLPDDVLVALLGKMPPKGLKALGETCQLLRYAVDDETIWKNCFVNRFFSYGSDVNKSDLTVLAQPSLTEGRGWKKECLAREAMLERWVNSKAMPVSHHPMGLIDALSLSYPTPIPPKPKTLIVGKTHSTPTKPSASSSAVPALIEPSPILPSPKMTHRQKYEALLAATTRPAPYVISAGISAGGMVRSDPLSGKVSKGFWGPGRDANFHLRARPDPNSPPTAIFLPTRAQTFALWGLSTGSIVHTTILTKHPSTPGNRASSLNVQCEPSVSHDSAVLDIWAPVNFSDTISDARFVTAGADGVIKYWHFTPPAPRSGKRSPASAHTETQGSLKCIFTSNPAVEPFANRSDAVKRRQTSSPDATVFARCSSLHDVVCGVTADGDLRVWSGIQGTPTDNIAHLRLDVGSEDEYGGVVKLELDVRTLANGAGTIAAVLVQHRAASYFTRYDLAIKLDGIELVRTLRFTSPLGLGFTKIEAFLDPSAPITSISHSISAARSPSVEGITEQESPLPSPTLSRVKDERFGRFVVSGDVDGWISIFPWDPTNADIISSPDETQSVRPIRVWQNGVTKITALDYHCGLVGVGSCNADIKVYDPYPDPPVLLRSYRASHLSAADAALAASDDQDAVYFTVNRIILENDLIVASVGRKVFGWRAGSGKKGGVKGDKKRVTSKGDFKGNVRALDMRSLNEDAAVEQQVMKQYPNSATRTRAQNHSERGQLAAMEDLGLEDGDDALQYALMLSMEDTHSRDLWQGEGEEDDLDSTLQSGSSAASAGSYQEDPFLAYESHRGGRSRRDNDPWREEAEVLRDVPEPISTSSSYRDALGSSLSSQRSTPSLPAPTNALLDAEDIDEETAAAIRAMEDAQRREEAELQQALEMIRLAEERA